MDSPSYYLGRLYPLQDKVLRILDPQDAAKKSPVDPLDVVHTIKTMPAEALQGVKWYPGVDIPGVHAGLLQVAQDVLLGRKNTLFP